MTMRSLGYLRSPSGENLVLLADGEAFVSVSVGIRLANGYVVQAIGQDAVRLLYPATGTLADVPIPPIRP